MNAFTEPPPGQAYGQFIEPIMRGIPMQAVTVVTPLARRPLSLSAVGAFTNRFLDMVSVALRARAALEHLSPRQRRAAAGAWYDDVTGSR